MAANLQIAVFLVRPATKVYLKSVDARTTVEKFCAQNGSKDVELTILENTAVH